MKKTAVFVLCAVVSALTGCTTREEMPINDQCMRNELFQQCMASLPAGPISTKYNDWDEVVEACQSVAYYHSIRPRGAVEPACRL